MNLIEKAKGIITDVRAYWKVPAAGDYVAYKEYLMLSLGWLGMRLATTFGIGFSVGNSFTAMTLHMTHKDLIILGYVCTAIGYLLAPFNAWLIDNLKSKSGKYKVFAKLAVPSGILSLFALFFPYEKMTYTSMVVSLFLIGQVQGYIQNWYSTGVSNLIYVISPNSQERVKIMMVSSLVHNFAPTITGFLIPVLSDKLAGGDLYNINTYRMVYPAIIVIGVALSMTAYYGVNERIVEPKSRVTGVSLIDALRDVSRNKLFWIKCTDNWNNFMEDSKNVLMQWIFYYGKRGSMTMYGIFDTLSYNSSMWAMLFSPWMIDKLGKKGFKLVKNISQIFIIIGLAKTYKKSLAFVFIFYFLNRFLETSEVIDRSIESDIRDYQQYISGERIDGSFGVIDTYVGGAIGAVTGLFVPWVYKRNGFDGSDYSVLNAFLENGSPNPNCVLYIILDKLLKISLVGAVIDIFPWFLYDLTETDQKSVIRVIRIRSAIEDKKAGKVDDKLYCEACEAVYSMREYTDKSKLPVSKDSGLSKSEIKQNKIFNEEIDISAFINNELNRYSTDFGREIISICRKIADYGETEFSQHFAELKTDVDALPYGTTKEEKALRTETKKSVQLIAHSLKSRKKLEKENISTYNDMLSESVFDLPEETKEDNAEKNKMIKIYKRQHKLYGKVMKPYLWAVRHLTLAEAYSDIDLFLDDYESVKLRVDEEDRKLREEADAAAERRRKEAEERKGKRLSSKR